MTIYSRGLEVNPDIHLEEQEMHQGLTAEIKIELAVADNLVI